MGLLDYRLEYKDANAEFEYQGAYKFAEKKKMQKCKFKFVDAYFFISYENMASLSGPMSTPALPRRATLPTVPSTGRLYQVTTRECHTCQYH